MARLVPAGEAVEQPQTPGARLVAAGGVQAPSTPATTWAGVPMNFAGEVSPAQHAAFTKAMTNGWGSGAPKFMYDVGGKVVDATGIPSLGAATSVVPDFLQSIFGANVGQAFGKPAMLGAAQNLMRSALKPTLDQVRKGRAGQAVQTMLEEGFSPTAGGVEKMKSTLDDLGSQVKSAIEKSGARINTKAVADFVPDAYPRFSEGPRAVSAADDLGKVQQEFLEHPNVMGASEIPVQVAQNMKRGYQRAVGDKGFGELKTPTTEGEKQIARGLRELIGEAVPAVKSPLEREAKIIAALKMAERRVAVDANKNPIGLGMLNPFTLPLWLWDRSALAKSLTARGLFSSSDSAPALSGAIAGILANPSGVPER